MLHRTACLFCLLLPFGLAAAGSWTPLVVLIVSYTFFGLDALSDELESPFDAGQNALPLSAMMRGMEIHKREMLGDAVLPEALQPVDYLGLSVGHSRGEQIFNQWAEARMLNKSADNPFRLSLLPRKS